MSEGKEPVSLSFLGGSIDDLSEQTFTELQRIIAKALKESGATGFTVALHETNESRNVRTVFLDSVVAP